MIYTTKKRIDIIIRTFILTMIFLSSGLAKLQAQSNNDVYVVARDANGEIYLHKYNNTNSGWDVVGNTNKTDIESIAIHPFNSTIYVVNGGELGTLSPSDGSFNSIGMIGIANGELGQLTIDNVQGITCSYDEEAIYVTHTLSGTDYDLLIKIDNSTGSVIPNSFKDSNNNDVDYAIIEKVVFSQDTFLGKVVDIAILPETNELFVLHATDSPSPNQLETRFAINNIQNGILESVTGEYNQLAEGFSADVNGFVYQLFVITKEKQEVPNSNLESDILYLDGSTENFLPSINGYNILDVDYVKSTCVDDLTVAENFTTGLPVNPLQSSSNSITTETTNSSNVEVQVNAGTVDFKSNHITLNAGFEVALNACFNAIVEPCD